MILKPNDLLKKLHKAEPLPNLFMLLGSEAFYRSQLLAAIPEYVFAEVDPADREVTAFDKDTSLNELEGVINSYPFFCGKSLVILRDEKLWGGKQDSDAKKQQMKKLLAILSDIPEYCTVILSATELKKSTKLYKDLAAKAVVCECESIKPRDLLPWLREQAQDFGGAFDNEAVAVIMEYLAAVESVPLQLLRREIEKLAIYAGERKKWGREDVESTFSALPEVGSFALNNAISVGDLPQALELLADKRKKGENIMPVCGFVMSNLRNMLRIKEMLNAGYGEGRIAAETGLHPFVVKKNLQACKRLSLKSLQTALNDLAEMNIAIRLGGRQYERMEEILVKLLTER
ncbi:MAG: DNA polymerase III subunit delta [Phascolarctobacterium sp.]|nr:DNA polymerase III subunit delta [Phascolarctobacterium sp.]